MFDIKTIPMEINKRDEVTSVVVNPADLYPLIVDRIKEVLAGANPSELLASVERGGSARADRLIGDARSLPSDAWGDALRPRNEFVELPYFAFVEKNGRARQNMLDLLTPDKRVEVERMIHRGYALEIAYGWFCQALRLEFGAYDLTIDRDEAYKL